MYKAVCLVTNTHVRMYEHVSIRITYYDYRCDSVEQMSRASASFNALKYRRGKDVKEDHARES